MKHAHGCWCPECAARVVSARAAEHELIRPDTDAVLRITLPVPSSKKNRMVVRRRKLPSGKVHHYPAPDGRVTSQHASIRDAVLQAIGGGGPMFGEHLDVAMAITWRADEGLVDVEVTGRPRVGANRSQDLANMTDTICDALEGAAYVNDRQVAAITLRKVSRA